MSNEGGIVKPPKAFPEIKDGETVLVFSTGGRKYIGIGQIRPAVTDAPDVFQEVYELKELPSMIPSKLVGGKPDMAIQAIIIFPDMGAYTGEPLQNFHVESFDWCYEPSKQALEMIEERISVLKMQVETAKRVQQQ